MFVILYHNLFFLFVGKPLLGSLMRCERVINHMDIHTENKFSNSYSLQIFVFINVFHNRANFSENREATQESSDNVKKMVI